jgi:hypothetical protein
MSKVDWQHPGAKLDRLMELLAPDRRKGKLRAIARHVVEQFGGEEEAGFSVETLSRDLSVCRAGVDVRGRGEIALVHVSRLMRAFDIPDAGYAWFLRAEAEEFGRHLDALCAERQRTNENGGLRLVPHQLTHVWNEEFRSDIGPVQGSPMGIVVSLSGRPLLFGSTNWSYGFTTVSLVLEMSGSPSLRLEEEEEAGAARDQAFQLRSRGVPNRPEFEIVTANNLAFDGQFVSDMLGQVTGASEGDLIKVRTRVERKEGVVAYLGPGEPPSKTKQEIIACIFGQKLPGARSTTLTQFATLCLQEIQVTGPDEGARANG